MSNKILEKSKTKNKTRKIIDKIERSKKKNKIWNWFYFILKFIVDSLRSKLGLISPKKHEIPYNICTTIYVEVAKWLQYFKQHTKIRRNCEAVSTVNCNVRVVSWKDIVEKSLLIANNEQSRAGQERVG